MPAPRHRAVEETRWLALRDGVRLATSVARPAGLGGPLPSVLIRAAEPVRGRSPTAWLARRLAERGYAVVAQECRGRHGSEGEFVPFESEAADADDAIAWLSDQAWWDGRLALVGIGYGAYAAFAAASRPGRRVAALVAAFGARDPHAVLFEGGAFRLAHGLRFAAAHCERGAVAERRVDWARGLRFRPVREADRVSLRRIDWYREWLEHPVADAFWQRRTPPLPSPAPPALLVSGWSDPCLPALLADAARLAEGGTELELVIGAWPAAQRAGPLAGLGRSGAFGACLRESLPFLDRHLGGGGARRPAARFQVLGERGWREAGAWPPPSREERCWYLRSGGSANSLAGDGRLDDALPGEDPPDRFRYDPDDPAPGAPHGAAAPDPRVAEARADLLCYTTAPLAGGLVLAGPARVELHAASSAPDTDWSARLVALAPDGRAARLGEGIARCRWRDGGAEPRWLAPGEPTRLAIAIAPRAARLDPGWRLRLEISSASFPRFDRNANVREDPARVGPEGARVAEQSVLHDAAHPSRLVVSGLRARDGTGPPATRAGGPVHPRPATG